MTMMRQARRTFGIGIMATVILQLHGGGSATAQPISIANFCDETVAHDYAKPFHRMPPVKGIPLSGQLLFAQGAVEIRPPEREILVPGEDLSLSYGLSLTSQNGSFRRPELKISSRLIQVSGRGRPMRVVGRRNLTLNVGGMKGRRELGFSYRMSARPAFYLVVTKFLRPDGTILRQYGEYFRVVRPTRSTQLVIYPRSIKAGEELAFRIRNSGAQSVSFGEPFKLEKEISGSWHWVRLYLNWHLPRFGLGAGEMGECQTIVVPSRLGPGLYRMRKDLLNPPDQLEAEFIIVS